MRTATNAIGFQVEVLTAYGWCVCGFMSPYVTRGEANKDMAERTAAAPGREYRVMPALSAQP